VAAHLSRHIVFGEIQGQMMSPVEMLLALLEVKWQIVDGPAAAGTTTYAKPTVPAAAFRKRRRIRQILSAVFTACPTKSSSVPRLFPRRFRATLAGSMDGSDPVRVVRGSIEFDRYFASDGRKSFNWVIHPEGFQWRAAAGPRPASGVDLEAGKTYKVVALDMLLDAICISVLLGWPALLFGDAILRIRVVDAETGRPIACTVTVRAADGKIVSDHPSFRGGFRAERDFEKRIPAGDLRVTVSRGFDYGAVEQNIKVRDDEVRELRISLQRRILSANSDG